MLTLLRFILEFTSVCAASLKNRTQRSEPPCAMNLHFVKIGGGRRLEVRK